MLGDAVISFGKHSGKTVAEVRRDHPDYVDWAKSWPPGPNCDGYMAFLSVCRRMDEDEREEEVTRTCDASRKRARVETGAPRRLELTDDVPCEQSGNLNEGLGESGATSDDAPQHDHKDAEPEVAKEAEEDTDDVPCEQNGNLNEGLGESGTTSDDAPQHDHKDAEPWEVAQQ